MKKKRIVKDLAYYMALPYKMEIVGIAESDGGGWEAYLPELGRLGTSGCGETPEEALACMREVQESVLSLWLEEGAIIPEPEPLEDQEKYSGRILLRISRDMHKRLMLQAAQQNMSLNAYLNQSISLSYSLDAFHAAVRERSEQVWPSARARKRA